MRNLVKRLELTAYWEEHPDALEEKIENPIIIAGLPRTGTTLMHNMLLAGGPNDFRTPVCFCLLKQCVTIVFHAVFLTLSSFSSVAGHKPQFDPGTSLICSRRCLGVGSLIKAALGN